MPRLLLPTLLLVTIMFLGHGWARAQSAPSSAAPFVHPGLLQSRQDLDRMKTAVAARQEPIYAGYLRLRSHPQSQTTYSLRGPLPQVGRNPNVRFGDFDSDANAAYQCAVLWAVTGDAAYAAKSKQILNAWSSTLKALTGGDAVLMAGLGPFKMVNAAEILRYTNSGWSESDIRQCERMFKEVVYPVLKDFAPFANGNWDTAALKTVLAIGVFCDDRPMFERALCYYVAGPGDGCLTHYIYESGQCQENGRDQAHTQLGLAHLGDCCEIAWNQGLNLYAYANNRLLQGFEYTARYNLGEPVPFQPDIDRTGKYTHAMISMRGGFRPVFEQIYNHYVNRVGLPAPCTRRVAERLRPEGPAQGADHPGFGTLLYSRPPAPAPAKFPDAPPAAPAGLVARSSSPSAIALSWVAPVGAVSYTVKRSAGGAPFAIVARDVAATTFTDTALTPGTLYTYTVAASGARTDSLPLSVSAGLPAPWTSLDIGAPALPGATAFDGRTYTLEAGGADIGGPADQFHFACAPMNGDGMITARYVPQLSSQFTRLGVMMRESLTSASAHASLLLLPVSGGRVNVERPGWYARLLTRAAAGAVTSTTAASAALADPYVTWGRLTGPCWLRLARAGDTFTASISPDGQVWTPVGRATLVLPRKLYVGLGACSHVPRITTTVLFDNVTQQVVSAGGGNRRMGVEAPAPS